jgi:CelD/BcsL family acetyltransferase involved in cellulose biosynthesis
MMINPQTDVTAVLLDDPARLAAMRDELSVLAQLPGAASSIVQHPDWLLYELHGRGAVTAPYVLLVRDLSGRLIGYAPFLNEQHRARIALGHRYLTIYRGRHLRLLGSGVVAAPDNRALVEERIAKALRDDRAIRVIRVQETVLPNSLAKVLAARGRGFRIVAANLLDQLNWTIEPQASAAAYLAAMDAKRRNDLTRRLRNVYKKLGDRARLQVFSTPEQMQEYGRLMNQVYANSWHAEAHAVDWQAPPRLALFQRLAEHQQVIGHLLMLGERPIAYVHGYRLGQRYVLDDTGYDEEFAALGVGSALVFQAIQDLLERHPDETIDFGYGDNQYKRVLATRQIPCGSLYAVRGWRAHMSFQIITPLRWIYRALRQLHLRRQARTANVVSFSPRSAAVGEVTGKRDAPRA